jgi:mannitol/fructose-specific phosphotransferase system IIA component (Ntr-type)
MTLADFTSPALVVPHLRGHDVAAVIQELSQALQREKRVADLLPFYHAALNREFMVSSDMEAGMAFPHARLPALKELSFALGRSDPPLVWGARSTGAVRLVFLAKDSRLVKQLQSAEDNFQMLEVLRQIELRTSSVPGAHRRTTPC